MRELALSTRTVSRRGGPGRVTAHRVVPGFTDTGMIEGRAALSRRHPDYEEAFKPLMEM